MYISIVVKREHLKLTQLSKIYFRFPKHYLEGQ